MTDLVKIRKHQPVTTSLLIAETFGKEHKSVLRAIENLECSPEFRQRNFAPSYYINEQNKKQPMFFITQDGFTFLAMGFRGKKAAQFKETYISQFNQMRTIVLNNSSPEWLTLRGNGKAIRKAETEEIQLFVKYAEKQGSKNAFRYYEVFTKLINRLLNIKDREQLTHLELLKLALVEHTATDAIKEGVQSGLYYKNVFQLAKNRIQKTVDGFKFIDLDSLNQ